MSNGVSTPNRRTVLRYASGIAATFGVAGRVGASSSRDPLKSDSDGKTSAWDSARCFIYEDYGVDRTYTDAAFDHITGGLKHAYNDNMISGYLVKAYDTVYDPTCPDELLPEFETWRNDHGYTETGVHLLINSCPQDTVVPGTSDGDEAFQTDSDAHASTYENGRGVGSFRGTAMMEPLHSWVSSDCSDVQDMMAKNKDGDGWNEHTLGTVVIGEHFGLRYNTPLAGGDYSVKNGQCRDSEGTADNETSDLSHCTREALQFSAEHQDGQH